MKNFGCIKDDSGISVFVDGQHHSVSKDHPNYKAIIECIKNDKKEKILDLVDIPKSVAKFSGDRIQVVDGYVKFMGEVVHNTICDRILQFMSEGFPFNPLVKFLDNLMDNSSKTSVDQLYPFLEHKHIPVTEDGCFLAYKSIRKDNWKDWHSNTFENKIGSVIEVPRNKVDDNPKNHCSHGFHVGSLEYASTFNPGDNQRLILVKVNPKDVVSVPEDHNCQKCRVCKYEVVDEYTGPLVKPLYRADSSEMPEDIYDDDYKYDNDSSYYEEDVEDTY